MKAKKIASYWVLGLLVFSAFSAYFHEAIQAHVLENSLKIFYDVFGRNIFFLTLNAAFVSFYTLLPLSIIYLVVGVLFSMVLTSLKKNSILTILIQSLIDILASLPGLLIGLAISAISKGSTIHVTIATAIMIFPGLIRFFESQLINFKAQPFYACSEALGATPLHLSIRHLLPELCSLCLAIYPFILSRLLYIETTLAFLGVASLSTTESWGQLINQGRDYMLEAPWLISVSGLTLVFTLWSFHLLTRRESS